jgi:homoserine dehydrogenase
LEVWADKYGVQILFEASVGGGIPVLGTLTNFLQANRIHKISGILNGTTNYILTQMDEKGRSFYEVLNEAQAKGYAEADPTSDIEGHDAAYKLAILIRLAFDAHVPVAKIQRQGIRGVSTLEMRLARSLGFSVKLLAQAEQFGENGPISCFVYPTLIPKEHPLASVNNVYNAIHIEGDYIHDLTLVGQGAGEKPTASAVVEDLCNVIRLKRRKSVRRVEPWVLEGELEAGAQFVLLAIAGAFYDQKWKNHQERLRKRGVQLLTWTTVRDEEYTWLGLIAKGWSDEVKQAVQAEFGWEVKKQIRRPVLLGNQMFPAETKVVHAAISL